MCMRNTEAVFSESLEKLPDAAMIREKVFVEEQGFETEFDETDSRSLHCVLYQDGKCAATVRFFTEDGRTMHIGRVAVLKEYRGTGLGAEVVRACEDYAVKQGFRRFELSAQVRVTGFYKSLGYIPFGDEYMDEFCPHINMYKEIADDT